MKTEKRPRTFRLIPIKTLTNCRKFPTPDDDQVSVACILIFSLCFLILHLLRMWGAIYQMVTGTIRDGCIAYEYDSKKLKKTPFAFGCLREIGLCLEGV